MRDVKREAMIRMGGKQIYHRPELPAREDAEHGETRAIPSEGQIFHVNRPADHHGPKQDYEEKRKFTE